MTEYFKTKVENRFSRRDVLMPRKASNVLVQNKASPQVREREKWRKNTGFEGLLAT